MSSPEALTIQEVFPIIDHIAKSNHSLTMTKAYKGVLLHQDVSILSTRADSIVVQTSERKVCAILNGPVFLRSELFPHPLRAQVSDFNRVTGRISLTNFCFMLDDWRDRGNSRVQPLTPTYPLLWHNRASCRAYLENLAVDGVGLLVHSSCKKKGELSADAPVTLEVQLLPFTQNLMLKGTTAYVLTGPSPFTRVGVRLHPRPEEARLLESYIERCHDEIMNELDEMYVEVLKPWGTEHLYF
jgi:hypothetical protein